MNESALVQATLHGDVEAFGTLACRYQQSLVASARHLIGSMDDAEDLAQEALLQAYQSLRTLREPDKFRAWLFTILRHLCLKHLERQSGASLSLDEIIDSLAAPETPDGANISLLLDRLPLLYREVLVAHYMMGLSYEEIGAEQGTNLHTVRMRAVRARALLKKLLRDEEEEERRVMTLAMSAVPLSSNADFMSRILMEVRSMPAPTPPSSAGRTASVMPGMTGGMWKMAGWLVIGVLALSLTMQSISLRSHRRGADSRGSIAGHISSTAQSNVQWSMFHHEPQYTGYSSLVEPSSPKIKWIYKYPLSGNVTAPSLGADGTIYFGSNDNILNAINPDGSKKWSFTTRQDRFVTNAAPTIGSDGTIYFGPMDHNLYALNPNGKQKWRFKLQRIIGSPVTLGLDGTIYVTSRDGLHAINPDGTQKWTTNDGTRKWANGGVTVVNTPAIGADGTLYIEGIKNYDAIVYALNPIDGAQKWSLNIGSGRGNHSWPDCSIAADGTIYTETSWPQNARNFCAITPNGTLRWQSPYVGFGGSAATGTDGSIYFDNNNGTVYALNPTNGLRRWAFNLLNSYGYELSSPMIGENGTIYEGSGLGALYFYAINPDGSMKWKLAVSGIPSTAAIAADGTLYFTTTDGKLYAVGD